MPFKVELFPTLLLKCRSRVCESLLQDIVEDVMRISASASLIDELSIPAIEKANKVASIIKGQKANQAKLSAQKITLSRIRQI